MSEKTDARKAALECLERCRRDKAWSGEGIDATVKKYGFDRRDAGLTAQLVLGVLENSTLLDFYIGCCYKGRLEPKLRDILRLGAYQLLFLDKIPARAAVNETVALCRQSGCQRATGLVNAVLRHIAQTQDSLPEIPGKGSPAYLSVKYSHPLWLCNYLIERRGYHGAEAFLKADNSPPELSIQVNTLKLGIDDYIKLLSDAGIDFRRCDFPDSCLALLGGKAANLPGFEDGLFYVQDRAARLALEAAGIRPGISVLDACSSPGGKSFAAGIAMGNKGEILSCDIHQKKLNLVSTGAERLGVSIISTQTMDARVFDPGLEKRFDLVIADVPCSGIGVIRKKPEIRNKNLEDISALPSIQRAILDNLARYVRPGGVLLYSTCTVIKEENEDVTDEFLVRNKDYSAEAFKLGDISAADGKYTFWPDLDGTDGFYIAKLRRAL